MSPSPTASGEPLRRLQARFGNAVKTHLLDAAAIAELTKRADLVIGAALLPGAAAPKLVTREMLPA